MATAFQDWIDAAYGKSLKNRPQEIATNATELYNVASRILYSLYSIASRVNPTFFAGTAAVAYASGWARPSAAESVFLIRDANGNEVGVVDILQPNAEPGKPCVYELDQVYYPATAASPNPQSGTLTFTFARRATIPPDLTTAIEAKWPEQFNNLPIVTIARYLADKDGRADELTGLNTDLEAWLKLYVAFLEHETANVVRRYATRRFTAPSLVSLKSLLVGGE